MMKQLYKNKNKLFLSVANIKKKNTIEDLNSKTVMMLTKSEVSIKFYVYILWPAFF